MAACLVLVLSGASALVMPAAEMWPTLSSPATRLSTPARVPLDINCRIVNAEPATGILWSPLACKIRRTRARVRFTSRVRNVLARFAKPQGAESSSDAADVVEAESDILAHERAESDILALPMSARISAEMKKVTEFALAKGQRSSLEKSYTPTAKEIEAFCDDDESGCDVELVEALKAAAYDLRMKQIKSRGLAQFDEYRWEEPVEA